MYKKKNMQKHVKLSDTAVCDYQTLYHVNQRPMDQRSFHSTVPKCTVLPSKTGVGLPTVFFSAEKAGGLNGGRSG